MSADPRFDGPGPDDVFNAALAEGRFQLQRCRVCGGLRCPPGLVCLACGSPDLAWVAASGAGEVYATTTVRARDGDYNVAIVELAEGPRMMSCVEGLAPEAVIIGMKVMARIAPEPEPHVVFEPVER